MTTRVHVGLTGTVEVALPPRDAFVLFTASGERRWAPGWDPRFPAAVEDETEPGTVFLVTNTGRTAVWTVVRREQGVGIEYSSVIPGRRAGLVAVSLAPSPAGTTATVTYVLTSLAPEADAELTAFAADYPQFLAQWRKLIAEAIAT